jgi:hypothetical protein
MATLLQTLKLSSAARSRTVSPVTQRRNKFLSYVSEQLEAAKAEERSEPFMPTVVRRSRDPESGALVAQTRVKQVRRCWWTNDSGVCFVELRYGVRRLEISKGKSTIEIGDRKKLVSTLELIRDAALLGEFDEQLQSASGRLAGRRRTAE